MIACLPAPATRRDGPLPPVWTLLDRGPRTEDRGADTHVCRAGPDRLLEVAAHPRREPGRAGWSAQEPRRIVGEPAERRRRGPRRAARPPSGRAARASRPRRPRRPGRRARRGPHPTRPVAPGGSRETWSSTSTGVRALVRAASTAAATSLRRSTDSTTSAYVATAAALLLCRPPMKCQARSRSAHSAALASASWWRFSPTSVTPSSARSRTSEAGKNLVTTTSVRRRARGRRRRRPRRSARGPRRARPRSRRGGSCRSRSQPDQAGQPAGRGAVAAVGVEVGGLAGAAASRRCTATPLVLELGADAGAEVERRACPTRSWRAAAGTTAATSARISRGDLVAARRTRAGPTQASIAAAPSSRIRGHASRARRRPPARAGRSGRRRSLPSRRDEQHRHAVGGADQQGRRPACAVTSASASRAVAPAAPSSATRDVGAVHLVEVAQRVVRREVGEQPAVVLAPWPRSRRRRRRRG